MAEQLFKAIMDTVKIGSAGKAALQTIIDILRAHPELANAVDPTSEKTALMFASEYSSPTVMKLLCEAGAKVNEQVATGPEEGCTALHYAINGMVQGPLSIDRVKFLLSRGANVNATSRPVGMTPLMLAARNGSADAIQLLCSVKVPGSTQTVVDIDAATMQGGFTALTWAAHYERIDALIALIDEGASPNGKLEYGAIKPSPTFPIIEAASKPPSIDSLNVATILFHAGANIDVTKEGDGATALMYAAKLGNKKMVELLLSYRANTESRINVSGDTALHYACSTGNEPIVKLLVEGGADVNATLNDGTTCLMIAALRGQAAASIPVTGFLLEHGVNLEAKDDKGRTVLNRVCATNRPNISKFLVEQGANINSTDNDGNTVLMNVILSQAADLPKKIVNTQLLCGNGVDLSIENRAHQTARDLAAIHLPGLVSLLDRCTLSRGRNLLAVEQTLGSRGSPIPENVVAHLAGFGTGRRGPLSAQMKSLRRNSISNNERRRRNRWNRIVGELPNAPPGTSLFEGGGTRRRKARRRRV